MVIRFSLALVMALLVALAGPADAQDSKASKGLKSRNLVTSLGGFTGAVNTPLLITGSQIEIEPGGHTGRQQFRVPTYVYVLDGILTTEYEAGPVGIAGAQYHAAGQSYMDNGGWWHNAFNRGQKPVKILILHIGYPGRPDPVNRPEPE